MTNKKEPKTYIITEEVLSRIRETVGSQIPETGGILGSSDGKHVDHFYFDVTASVTGATYEPDCDKLNLIIQKWYEKGIDFVGFIHSHPRGAVKPSDPDNLYTTKIMKAFEMEWFVSLIVQVHRSLKGEKAKLFAYGYYLADPCCYFEFGRIDEKKPSFEFPAINLEEDQDRSYREMLAKKYPFSKEELNRRNKGLFPEDVLARKTLFVGGTGGSIGLVLDMVRSGVIKIIICDGDTFETHNMSNHCLKDGQLTIIPEEAEIVRMIFDDYLSGMGRLAIAKKLNAIHVPTVRGCDDWREGSIYRILHNEKYTGDMILQKTYVEDFRTKKGVINRGEKRKYFVENSHEAIISKEIFERAQAEAERRKVKIKLPEKRMKTIFTGMLICACCGKHFNRRVANASTKYAKPAWICATFMRKGKKYCNNRQIPEKILIAKTKEVLGLPSLEDIDLKDYISEIVCGKDYDLTYIMNSGAEVKTIWHPYSRKDSWNEEMRQQARNRTLERSTLYE